jgi:hypothetical protein
MQVVGLEATGIRSARVAAVFMTAATAVAVGRPHLRRHVAAEQSWEPQDVCIFKKKRSKLHHKFVLEFASLKRKP